MMLRSSLLVIGHILTVDIKGLVKKMVGGIENNASFSRHSLAFSPVKLVLGGRSPMSGKVAKRRGGPLQRRKE